MEKTKVFIFFSNISFRLKTKKLLINLKRVVRLINSRKKFIKINGKIGRINVWIINLRN
jgi:hypothetical protein